MNGINLKLDIYLSPGYLWTFDVLKINFKELFYGRKYKKIKFAYGKCN